MELLITIGYLWFMIQESKRATLSIHKLAGLKKEREKIFNYLVENESWGTRSFIHV